MNPKSNRAFLKRNTKINLISIHESRSVVQLIHKKNLLSIEFNVLLIHIFNTKCYWTCEIKVKSFIFIFIVMRPFFQPQKKLKLLMFYIDDGGGYNLLLSYLGMAIEIFLFCVIDTQQFLFFGIFYLKRNDTMAKYFFLLFVVIERLLLH